MTARIICAFPGQGSQFVGMGKNLYDQDADVRGLYQQANDALGYDLQRLCFEGPDEQLRLTAHTQPAILVHSVAAWTLLRKRSLQPRWLAGHSLGEYAALVAAGVLTFADAIRLVHKRGAFMQAAVPPGRGSMAALLGVSRPEAEALCHEFAGQGVLQPANYNAPGQIVIAGDTTCVHAAVAAVKARGLGRTVLLNVSAPFHCQLLRPAAEQLTAALAEMLTGHFTFPVIANVSAVPYPSSDVVKEFLIKQVCAPVRWEESMQYAVAHGGEEFLEVGPGKVLSAMMRRIAPHVKVLGLDEVLDL
jgi:[acyl-carrier-protein] S-malonyltransferase